MAENTQNAGLQAEAAPAPKPKRPKAKSLIMIGEQTDALFASARAAKERANRSAGRLPSSRRRLQRRWAWSCCTRKITRQV